MPSNYNMKLYVPNQYSDTFDLKVLSSSVLYYTILLEQLLMAFKDCSS
jgi:hypothetical protein